MTHRLARVTALVTLMAAGIAAQVQKQGIVKPLSEVNFGPDDSGKCLKSASESGNPATGPSTFILKAPPDCAVPWHYHTAEEQLFVSRGEVATEMEGMPSRVLGPGGFALMPSKVKHQFSCKSKNDCVMFVTFDRVYDIFWVKDAAPSKGLAK